MKEFTQEKTYNINSLNERAKEFFDKKQYSKAISCFEEISADYDFPEELKINLAKCYYYNRQAPEAIKILQSYKQFDHDSLLDFAIYKNALGGFEEALQIYESLDQSDPKVKFNIGWHMMRKGKFKEAFKLLEYGSQCRAWGHEYIHLENKKIDPQKRWDGKKTGKLLLFLEGGIGDCFIFIRWAKYLETLCDELIITTPKSIQRLLANAGYNVVPDYALEHLQYDHYVPSMSLPNFIDVSGPLDKVTLPYINSISEPYITRGMEKMSSSNPCGKLKIGVRWMGNPEFEHDQFRTISKESFFNLTQYGTLFSLQLEEEEDDDHFIPCRHVIKDWQDTYSIFSELDLLVTSCTSTAHLAGAMNIPTIVMVPLVPYFIWASDELSWYESVTVVRQKDYNDWSGSIKEMYELVESFSNKYK